MLRSLVFLGAAGIAAVIGCTSVVTIASSTGTGGGSSRSSGAANGGGNAGTGGMGGDTFVDPGCPDAGMKPTEFTCDPYHQDNGDCEPGEGCYIFSTPPTTPCGQETYGSTCEPEGMGQQGAPCGNVADCAAGFTCVVSDSGTQCVLLCELMGSMECPDGLVCEPIDVQGFGGCL